MGCAIGWAGVGRWRPRCCWPYRHRRFTSRGRSIAPSWSPPVAWPWRGADQLHRHTSTSYPLWGSSRPGPGPVRRPRYFFTLLLIFALFGLVLYLGARLLGRTSGWASLVAAWSALVASKGRLSRTAIVLAAAFGLTATTLVLHPAGLGLAADLIGRLGPRLSAGAGRPALPLPDAASAAIRTAHPAAGPGRGRLGMLRSRTDPCWSAQPDQAFPHTAFLAFWVAAAGLIILLAGHRPAGNSYWWWSHWPCLPARGSSVPAVGEQARTLASAAVFAAVALAVLVFFYLQLELLQPCQPHRRNAHCGPHTVYHVQPPDFGPVSLLLLIGLGAVVWIWRGPAIVVAGGWLTVLVALGLVGFQAMWGLNFAHASDPRELMISKPQPRRYASWSSRLEALSREKAGDAHTLPITIDQPRARWLPGIYASSRTRRWLRVCPILQDTLAAVTLVMENPPIGETFRGQGFPLRTQWLFPQLQQGHGPSGARSWPVGCCSQREINPL